MNSITLKNFVKESESNCTDYYQINYKIIRKTLNNYIKKYDDKKGFNGNIHIKRAFALDLLKEWIILMIFSFSLKFLLKRKKNL